MGFGRSLIDVELNGKVENYIFLTRSCPFVGGHRCSDSTYVRSPFPSRCRCWH